MRSHYSIFLTVLFIALSNYAGNERGNGGDVAIGPNGEVRFLDAIRQPNAIQLNLESPQLAPALEARLNAMPNIISMTFFSDSRARNLKSHLVNTLRSLRFYLVKGPLPEINDRGIVKLPWKNGKGRIERLAYQSIQKRTVIVDRDYFEALPDQDLVLFLAHEGFIRLYYDDYNNSQPLETTEKISLLVNQLFQSNDLPASIVKQYLCDLNIVTSENSFSGYKKISAILTPLKYPEEIVVTFRSPDEKNCYSFELTRTGPANGKFKPHPFQVELGDGVYTWTFKLKNTDYNAQIRLIHNLSTRQTDLDFYVTTELGGVGNPRDLHLSKFQIWQAN